MLKTILSVTGKPGLFKLISSGKNMVVVESLTENKRIPIYARDKVVSLGDIAMYTAEGEVPLQEVLISIKQKENGNIASIQPSASPEDLKKYLSEILPTYDKERIYSSDIKKLVSWYNLLITTKIDFETKQEAAAGEETADAKEEVKAVLPKAEAPKKEKKAKVPVATTKKTTVEKKTRSKKG
ncbi:DUF5606 family protein [Viscerimonas tarda]